MPLKIAGFFELLITVRTGVNVGHFLNVLDQESVVTVPTNGHWLNAYGFIVCWLSCKPPGVVLTGVVYTNAEFELLLNFLELTQLDASVGF